MTKTFLTAAIAIIASFSTAHANDECDTYMADSSISQAAIVDDMVDNDIIKCWGWDGSSNGQVKTMGRADCFSMHGTVVNQDIRMRDDGGGAVAHRKRR